MEEHHRNQEISNLLNIWEWCSRSLHVKWKRERKLRNDCLMGIAYAVSEGMFARDINGFTLPQIYKTLPVPLLNEATFLEFWDAHPTALLEMLSALLPKDRP
jgi:hypothetical protein